MRIIHYLEELGVINNKWGDGSKIKKKISPEKIFFSCLVNATTTHDSVTEQFIN